MFHILIYDTKQSCYSMSAGRLFLATLLVMSAFSVVTTDDRWHRVMTRNRVSESENPSANIDGSNGPTGILVNDGQENPSTDERRKPSVLRYMIKKSSDGNGSTEDYDWDENYLEDENITSAVRQNTTNVTETSSNVNLSVVVDVLAVVDYKLYTRFLNRNNNNTNKTVEAIKKYYRYVFTVVDSRYSLINDSELSIRVRLIGIFIAQNESDSPWSENYAHNNSRTIDSTLGARQFGYWLRDQHGTLPKHDHAMGFTGYTMITAVGHINPGLARRSTNCDVASGRASSLVQEDGGLASVTLAVHELGHAIGTAHDGDGANTDCPAYKSYIMATRRTSDTEYYKNHFLFSPCTIRSFKSVLSSQNIQCLLDSVPDKISVLPGQFVSADDQCKDYYGQNSGDCYRSTWPRADDFCTIIYCKRPIEGPCLVMGRLTPILGTPCANGKVCMSGECLNQTEVLETLKKLGSNMTHTRFIVHKPRCRSKLSRLT